MQAQTRDLGLAIRDFLEGSWIHTFIDHNGELIESNDLRTVETVDASDPDNLRLSLDNGQTFTVRIVSP